MDVSVIISFAVDALISLDAGKKTVSKWFICLKLENKNFLRIGLNKKKIAITKTKCKLL